MLRSPKSKALHRIRQDLRSYIDRSSRCSALVGRASEESGDGEGTSQPDVEDVRPEPTHINERTLTSMCRAWELNIWRAPFPYCCFAR